MRSTQMATGICRLTGRKSDLLVSGYVFFFCACRIASSGGRLS